MKINPQKLAIIAIILALSAFALPVATEQIYNFIETENINVTQDEYNITISVDMSNKVNKSGDNMTGALNASGGILTSSIGYRDTFISGENTTTVSNASTSGFTSPNVSFDGVRWTDDGLLAIHLRNDSQANMSGLVGYWSMDENTGTIVHQMNTESGLVNTTNQGTWNGNTTLNYTTGRIGNALAFDGVDDYVDIPLSITSRNLKSISVWMKPDVLNKQMYMYETSDTYVLSSRIETDGTLSVFSAVSNPTFPSVTSIPIQNIISLVTTTYTNVVQVIQDNGIMNVYVNGEFKKQAIWNASTLNYTNNNLSVNATQGVTSDNTYIYTTSNNYLYKYYKNGTFVQSVAVETHMGDLVYKDELLYVAWSDNTWVEGATSSIKIYYASNLSFKEEHNIYAGRGAGGVTYNINTGHFLVLESTTVTDWSRADHIYEFDESFNPITNYITEFHSYYGLQGISYNPDKNTYILTEHGARFYQTDSEFNLINAGSLATGFDLQGLQWINDTNLYISDKSGYVREVSVYYGQASLLTYDNFHIGSDRNVNRYFNGSIDEVRVYNRALSSEEISVLYNTSMRTQGNLTILNQSASSGNVINRTRIVYTGQDSINNASIYSRQNGTSTWNLVQSNVTSNTWYSITNQYQNNDFRVQLNSNGSNTPFFTSLEWDTNGDGTIILMYKNRVMIIQGVTIFSSKTGEGTDYACFDSAGTLIRQNTAC